MGLPSHIANEILNTTFYGLETEHKAIHKKIIPEYVFYSLDICIIFL